MNTATAQAKETLGFQAEVRELLKLMIHSLYSHREIFLRELISNASDANDKLRFESLSKPDLMSGDTELAIWIEADPDKKTLTIRDNGIGMSREEAVSHLGTIARSGHYLPLVRSAITLAVPSFFCVSAASRRRHNG